MNIKLRTSMAVLAMALFSVSCFNSDDNGGGSVITLDNVDSSAPSSTVRLMFIHHSTGRQWLSAGPSSTSANYGKLGQELNNNNYYVTDSDYGWESIGSTTDTVHWPDWFKDSVMSSVYSNTTVGAYSGANFSNSFSDPGGENEVIMFKSCYPNSEVGDSIDDEKSIYSGLLSYFAQHTDKMFVLIIPPPEQNINNPAKTRELANWLVDFNNGWLAGYAHRNVFAYDYYNVLTDPNNHHYVQDSSVKHIVSDSPVDAVNPNELYYPSGDNHPSVTGQQKATEEFVPVLNAFYHIWKG
ncbi:MAG: hypothetical protein GY754_11020 [bacterium]|nr:hypothetical protein [bacterium]